MPNWCSNKVTFVHPDHLQIKRVADAFNRGELFAEFKPCPKELIETEASPGVESEQRSNNVIKYGHSDWYEWCLANWGTKWDISGDDEVDIDDGETVVNLWFDTAWSPPIAFYQAMEALGFKVDAFYYEPGSGFCGRYSMGDDEYFEILGNAEWVEKNIPVEIDDAFSIAECMSDWEEDQEDDES